MSTKQCKLENGALFYADEDDPRVQKYEQGYDLYQDDKGEVKSRNEKSRKNIVDLKVKVLNKTATTEDLTNMVEYLIEKVDR